MSVSKIQRAWDKAWEWADIKFSKKILISHFAEGGTLTQWKAEKLQKRVKEKGTVFVEKDQCAGAAGAGVEIPLCGCLSGRNPAKWKISVPRFVYDGKSIWGGTADSSSFV